IFFPFLMVPKLLFMKYFFIVLVCILFQINSFAQQKISIKDIQAAEKIIGLEFGEAKNDSLLGSVRSRVKIYDKMHSLPLANSIPLSTSFSPVLPYMKFDQMQHPVHFSIQNEIKLPANKNDLAFYSIPQLASLIKNKIITSTELTS